MKIASVGVRGQKAIERALEDTTHSLIWCARTGAEALGLFADKRPDVLLIPAALSDMAPAVLTRAVLSKGKCAVVLLVDSGSRKVSQVYEAMGAGALDVVTSPVLDKQGNAIGADALIAKLRTAGRLLGHESELLHALGAPAARVARAVPPLVAIGASTGGPQALLTVLANLPKGFAAAIAIVQHIDSEFIGGLASWLQDGSGIPVDIALDGTVPKAGTAIVAAKQDHLVMTAGGAFRYRAEPVDQIYRPSVDVFFSSLAEHWTTPAVAVLLTGMGRDGAEGMRKLRRVGWHTIAQDEGTSVVYGMPKAAVQLGAACKILPLEQIAGEVASGVTNWRRAAARG